jgi:GNAT superfamily N-acetyltransferase
LSAPDARARLSELAEVLHDCVEGGASVSFMLPFSQEDAEAFFSKVIDGVEAGERILLAALKNSRVVGTVQITTAMPPNQPHRGDVAKLLVHRESRGSGLARLLMEEVERQAREAGKTLLVLDTVTDGVAEGLYGRLGWTRVGIIPDYAMYPDGTLTPTTIFYKSL